MKCVESLRRRSLQSVRIFIKYTKLYPIKQKIILNYPIQMVAYRHKNTLLRRRRRCKARSMKICQDFRVDALLMEFVYILIICTRIAHNVAGIFTGCFKSLSFVRHHAGTTRRFFSPATKKHFSI